MHMCEIFVDCCDLVQADFIHVFQRNFAKVILNLPVSVM